MGMVGGEGCLAGKKALFSRGSYREKKPDLAHSKFRLNMHCRTKSKSQGKKCLKGRNCTGKIYSSDSPWVKEKTKTELQI